MKKYNIIYADPPWRYENRRKGYGGVKDHYQTMKVDDICNLSIWDVWGNEVQSDIIFTQKVQEPEGRGSEHGTI